MIYYLIRSRQHSCDSRGHIVHDVVYPIGEQMADPRSFIATQRKIVFNMETYLE